MTERRFYWPVERENKRFGQLLLEKIADIQARDSSDLSRLLDIERNLELLSY